MWPTLLFLMPCHVTVEVDVIGLLETDAARPYIGNHDIASWLSDRLHMFVDYGPGPKAHTWGSVQSRDTPVTSCDSHVTCLQNLGVVQVPHPQDRAPFAAFPCR